MDFFIVWGRKVRAKLLGHTVWKCPACGRLSPATVRDKESSFHLYFIPFGYSYAGRFGECLWCETELLLEPDQQPVVDEASWRPGDAEERLAAALGQKLDTRAFKAPPSAEQMLLLWSNLRWRFKKVGGENLGRFSLSSGVVWAAAVGPVFALAGLVTALIVGPEGLPAGQGPILTMLLGLASGVVIGFVLGLIYGSAFRALWGNRGYADRKLRGVLGDDIPLAPLKKLLEQARRAVEPPGRRLWETPLDQANLEKAQELLEQVSQELQRHGLAAPRSEAAAPPPGPAATPAAADLELACPHCRKKLKVPRKLIGKTVRCPACKQPFTIGEP